MKDCFEKTMEETALTIKKQERWFILDANMSVMVHRFLKYHIPTRWQFHGLFIVTTQSSKITHFQMLDGYIVRYLKPSRTN